MDEEWSRTGFGGQTLDVFLETESQLFRSAPEERWIDQGGGHLLTGVLGRCLDDSFPYLKSLDEYGTTVFNALQLRDVIPELRRLLEHTQTPDERSVVEKVIDMAGKARESSHHFLVFEGD